MPFYIVKGDMGFCGTDSIEIIEAESASIAEDQYYEELEQNITVDVQMGFDTEEEAENVLEDY